MDMVVVPSRFEGFGLTLTLPVVCAVSFPSEILTVKVKLPVWTSEGVQEKLPFPEFRLAPEGKSPDSKVRLSPSGSDPEKLRVAVSPAVTVTEPPPSIVGGRFTSLTVIEIFVVLSAVPSETFAASV